MADAVPQTERRTPGRVENMVVDAVHREPVSTLKFPITGKINGNFSEIGLVFKISRLFNEQAQ
jgi:hypothetical protein